MSRWDLRMCLPRMKETLFSCGSDAFICNNDLFLFLLLFAALTRPWCDLIMCVQACWAWASQCRNWGNAQEWLFIHIFNLKWKNDHEPFQVHLNMKCTRHSKCICFVIHGTPFLCKQTVFAYETSVTLNSPCRIDAPFSNWMFQSFIWEEESQKCKICMRLFLLWNTSYSDKCWGPVDLDWHWDISSEYLSFHWKYFLNEAE